LKQPDDVLTFAVRGAAVAALEVVAVGAGGTLSYNFKFIQQGNIARRMAYADYELTGLHSRFQIFTVKAKVFNT